jgi:hypothetical protein
MGLHHQLAWTSIWCTLPAEFKGDEEEVAQICLDPKEAVFEKPE